MKSDALNKLVKVMTKLDRVESLQAMVILVLAQPDHQALLANMLKMVTQRLLTFQYLCRLRWISFHCWLLATKWRINSVFSQRNLRASSIS